MVRLPRRWHSDAEPDEVRWWLGRMEAHARGMRQAAARDRIAPANSRQPGPVPPTRQALKQERGRQRRDPATDLGRAQTLARAIEQSSARNRRSR